MNYREQALAFASGPETLVGVLAEPPQGAPTIGIIVVVGGPQYRAGSHRQFVLLARALASAGYPTLRFDCRGMGDSTGEPQSFEQSTPDIAASVDALLGAGKTIRQVVLWGLCDGASASLMYCHSSNDRRVAGLCMLNPWVRSESSLAKAQIKHYYVQRLRQKEFWQKLLGGKVAGEALRGLARNLMAALRKPTAAAPASTLPFQTQMALAWTRGGRPIQLLLSQNDTTAREFLEYVASDPAWSGALSQSRLARSEIANADHTFSSAEWRAEVEARTLDWLAELPAAQI